MKASYCARNAYKYVVIPLCFRGAAGLGETGKKNLVESLQLVPPDYWFATVHWLCPERCSGPGNVRSLGQRPG